MLGSGTHISIKELAVLIKKIVNYKGQIYFNKSYPDGVKLRKLDIKKMNKLGWKAKIKLKDGLKNIANIFKTKNLSDINKFFGKTKYK